MRNVLRLNLFSRCVLFINLSSYFVKYVVIVLNLCVVVLRIKYELLSDPCHGSARLNCQRVNYDGWVDPF